MDRKIFKKSNKSRIRYTLDIEPRYYWWLRSADCSYYNSRIVAVIIESGMVSYYNACYYYNVLPACTI